MNTPHNGVPPQEQLAFDSFLLKRTVTFPELYTMPQDELDLLIAETKTVQYDPETRPAKRKLCGYFKEVALLITQRKTES